MVKEVESWFALKDGTKLFSKTWIPETKPIAHLIYIHGFSDRCEIHHYLFPTLASLEIQTHSFDQRGWGKSVQTPSQKGLTGPTSLVLSDIHEFILHTSSLLPPSTPLFMMGHSMGGQETLHYTLTTKPSLLINRPRLSGVIIEAPYIALDPSSEPNAITVFMGKLAAKLMPKMQMKQKLAAEFNTRDPEVNREWAEDELCHDTGTLEGLRDMLQRGADLVSLAHSHPSSSTHSSLNLSTSIPVPILWTHGSEDKICALPPSQALFNHLTPCPSPPPGIQAKTFKVYEGAYHKIHCEPDGVGVAFAEDVGSWIRGVVEAEEKKAGLKVEGEGGEREGNVQTGIEMKRESTEGSTLNGKAKL